VISCPKQTAEGMWEPEENHPQSAEPLPAAGLGLGLPAQDAFSGQAA
jgi:hypothetical protein